MSRDDKIDDFFTTLEIICFVIVLNLFDTGTGVLLGFAVVIILGRLMRKVYMQGDCMDEDFEEPASDDDRSYTDSDAQE